MTGFFALLRLQLLSRLADLKPRNLKANWREKKGKTIGMIIAYLVLAVYLLGFLIYIENALLNALIPMGMPDLLLTMAVMLGMLSTLILSFFFILSSLYFSRDAALIASLPVKSRTVLAAKLAQVWISETGIAALFILPACILYGIKVGVDALFYVRMVLVWMGIAVLPIVIIAFLSTLLIRLSALWKRREMVATVGGIALLVAYMFFCMNVGSMVGNSESGDMIAAFMTSNSSRIEALSRYFPPATWAAKGLQGDWAQLALFLAACAAAMAFTVWALGFVYRKLSLLQTETPTAARKTGSRTASYASGSAFKACVQREVRQMLRVPSYATNSLPTAFMPVLIVGMMSIAMSRALSQEGTDIQTLFGQIGNAAIIVPILTAVMSYMAGMNPALSTAVSREGRGHEFLMSLPIPPRTPILAKMAVGYGMSLAGCAAASVLLMVILPAFRVHAALALLLSALYCYITSAIALARDIKHPKLNWSTEQEAMKQNFGAAIAMFIGWGLLIALGGLTYLLLTWGLDMYAYTGVMALLLLIGCAVAHRHLMRTADACYWQG